MNLARKLLLLGVGTGLIAPVGLVVYGAVSGSAPNPFVIFAVMAVGGMTALGTAGFMIGKREDQLAERNDRLQRVSQELQAQTTTDALTGISNRRAFDYHLARELARADRYEIPLSLVMIDIDHFKLLNDEHGHRAGDDVLRAVATSIDREKRQEDLVARYGGEEFVALLPHANAEQAAAWAERARRAVAQTETTHGEGLPLRATASFGVAQWFPGIRTPEAFIEAADAALYAAKRDGRDRVRVFSAQGRVGLLSVM